MIVRPSLRTLGRRSGELPLACTTAFLMSVDTRNFFICSPCVTLLETQSVLYSSAYVSGVIQFMFNANFRRPRIPQDIKTLIPKQTPTWGAGPGNEGSAKATWLGYAIV